VRQIDLHLRRLYRATFLFGMACGMSLAMTSIHLDARGYGKQDIGTLAIFFASGLALFAIPVGALIQRFSGKRVLLAAMLGYAATVALFPFQPTYKSIALVRFIDGLCSVAIWVSSESIVLSRAEKEHKAYLTTLYAIWLGSGYVAGSVFAWGVTHFVTRETTFLIAAGLALVSAAYIALQVPVDTLGRSKAPTEEKAQAQAQVGEGEGDAKPSSALSILWRIKTSCFAMYSYGYFQSSVVLFLPLYLIETKGMPAQNTQVLVALFCFGMLTCSNIAGRIADRVGYLRSMRVLAFLGLLCVLGFVYLDEFWLMYVAVYGAGGAFGSMSGVSLALSGVVTERPDYSRANAIYNVFYAVGMLMGPPITSAIFQRYQGKVMLFHFAGLWAAFVLFTVLFMYDDPSVGGRRRREEAKAARELPAGS